MCLRKLQNWRLTNIYSEFTRFTRDPRVSSTESEFVESFNGEVIIPTEVPSWLWPARITTHPTIRIKIQAPTKDQSKKVKTEHAYWKEPESNISRKISALALEDGKSLKRSQ
eukprot:TRINITY_DN3682_c0_g1_i3.p2 TRINITY_DN3682_c0_g1~~TRINITY_DN3682_c0_g1_i3.p2  ORF type:complete len:112 (+),score=12.20 TRINITY_DN3682_c0_g1_i3:456-791(+)